MRRFLFGVLISAAASIAGLTVVGFAQTPADPTFEVASIKPTKVSGMAFVQFLPGGRVRVTNFPVQGLITTAWRLQGSQIDGGPAWIRSEGFDIEAKAEGNPPTDQMLMMLRRLLLDRFNLRMRTETRDLDARCQVCGRG